jgi:hypothetical protein
MNCNKNVVFTTIMKLNNFHSKTLTNTITQEQMNCGIDHLICAIYVHMISVLTDYTIPLKLSFYMKLKKTET